MYQAKRVMKAAATVLAVLSLPLTSHCQFPPKPQGVTLVRSYLGEGVYITYKQPGLCETTPGVKSYAGYVHLPPKSLQNLDVSQNYPINTFFWFFESRKDPENAPLAIWLNGGPGDSSMIGALAENRPCFVNGDSNSTYLNPWSWNNEVNMLYIDQPVQVGYSYDILINVTVDLISGETDILNPGDPIPHQNATFLVGTYPSQNPNTTAQDTEQAARALWNFAQIWFQEFPAYKPNDHRVSLATESYGGRYGPAFASFFETQNQKILNGTWTAKGETHPLHLDTLMLISGCTDQAVQWPSYPQQAYNNTYGIRGINRTVYGAVLHDLNKPGGCLDQVYHCGNLSLLYDPDTLAHNQSVNAVCAAAENYCDTNVRSAGWNPSNRDFYDIVRVTPDPFPAVLGMGWLNQPHVQSALGVPLNFTVGSNAVITSLYGNGDFPRPVSTRDIGQLLDSGVKVALVHGDRDYICNWVGGEAVSLDLPYKHTKQFQAAGYADLHGNTTYIGGQTRQYGNFSFTRVYQAGHELPAYQGETALAIFNRLLNDRDVATGTIDTAKQANYITHGPSDTLHIRQVPPSDQLLGYCYLWVAGGTCTEEQIEAVVNGLALIKDWIVVDHDSQTLFPQFLGNMTSS